MERTKIAEHAALLERLPSPDQMDKRELVDLLLREEYGYLPPAPDSVEVETVSVEKSGWFAGKAVYSHLMFHCKGSFGEFSFPVQYVCPKVEEKKKLPAFVHINFHSQLPNRFQPTEEIIDHGYALLHFCYEDISSDDGDFTNGLAGVVYPNGKREARQCGKIGLWAWAALRVIDYAMTLPELDSCHISVAGHSRLGKTALLTGALDERLFCAISNDSGCCGAALSRENTGETLAAICKRFPYWFSEHYLQYVDREEELPFDQHYLLAANYPHRVYVASADADAWACPKNEFLSSLAASEYYRARGMTGLICGDEMPVIGDSFQEGCIAYHLRAGTHFMSREDWNLYCRYLDAHKVVKK